MDSIPKFMASVITIIIGVVLCISLIISAVVVNSARTYHSSVIDQIEASDFDEATIEKCKQKAKDDNYVLTVEKTSTPENSVTPMYKVTLNYGLYAPIFGKVHNGKLVGYALPGSRIGEGSGETATQPVPGLYETGKNYDPSALITPWDELISEGVVSVTDGTLKTPYDSSSHTNTSADVLVGDLLLPYDGTVTAIADEGFLLCKSLSGIRMPDVLTTIGQHAFGACDGLRTVDFGAGLETVGFGAFEYCGYLEKVTYSGAIEDWYNISFVNMSSNPVYGGVAFYANGRLVENVTVPKDVTSLENLFTACESLRSVTVPAGGQLTSIDDYAFSDCYGLVGVYIGEGVTSIGSSFAGCTSLKEVLIPKTVTSIATDAFVRCTELNNIIIAPGNPVYHNSGGCLIKTADNKVVVGTANCTIPSGITTIGEFAFEGCTNLINIAIPSTVSTLELRAFYGCENLTSITIGSGVTKIGDYCFAGCSKLTDIYYEGSMEQWKDISFGTSWNRSTGEYTVHCTDGELTK